MFKLGVMTEEAGDDLQTVLRVIRDLGLEFVEISWLWKKKVSEFSDQEVDIINLGLNDNGVSVSCISPMVFFNVPLRAAANERSYWGSYTRHMEDLRRSIEIAHRLGTRIIRVFGFKTEVLLDPPLSGDHWPLLLDKFREPSELAEKEDVILAVETCFFNSISTCSLARRLLDDLRSSHVKVCWDISNCLYFGENPFPDGYDLIQDDIAHIHLKDGVPDLPNMTFRMCPLGAGQVQKYPEIFAALRRRRYTGGMSLECEFVPPGGTKVDALRHSLAGYRKLIARGQRD